jgi:flagellar basal-body rod modification protein FlgD
MNVTAVGNDYPVRTMTTDSTSSTSHTPSVPVVTPTDGISSQDFLQLLVAELKNQDPTSPMDQKEFMGQLAQINTVQQLSTLNTTMTDYLTFQVTSEAISMIGRKVEAAPAGKDPISGTVQEVSFGKSGPVLLVDGKEVGLSDITKVTAAS